MAGRTSVYRNLEGAIGFIEGKMGRRGVMLEVKLEDISLLENVEFTNCRHLPNAVALCDAKAQGLRQPQSGVMPIEIRDLLAKVKLRRLVDRSEFFLHLEQKFVLRNTDVNTRLLSYT